jgi:chemotaxis protein CheX
MVAEPDIRGIASAVWGEMLGLPLEEAAAVRPPECITGFVEISGGFSGTVRVELSRPLARKVAAALFGMELEQVSDAEVVDAVGEVVNILGGNLKALLPGPSTLSLPRVEDGDVAGEPGRLHARAGLSSEAQALCISLFETPAP